MCQKCIYVVVDFCYIAILIFIFCIQVIDSNRVLIPCHDDPTFLPEVGPLLELQFTWLGTLQYIHIYNGTPYYFRAPRVVLVTKQFVLSTAHDAAQVPDGYALGNIVFGDYERDEEECGVTPQDIAYGAPCAPALMLIPIADVLLHPEYKNFGVKFSFALMKLVVPVVSKYVLPVCLPQNDYLEKNGDGTSTLETLFHVDFPAAVPRVFVDEVKYISILNEQTTTLCTHEGEFNMSQYQICTTGCDLHSGAPTIIHEHTGHWTIVAMSLGGSWCQDPLQIQRPSPPPRHLLVHPYVNWITTAIHGNIPTSVRKMNDPFGIEIPRMTNAQRLTQGWVGHWWIGGLRCYDRGIAAVGVFRFYHELFTIKPVMITNLTYYIEIHGPLDVKIICVKVGMPAQLAEPRVWQLDRSDVKLRIPIRNITYKFQFEVEAWAYNNTIAEAYYAGKEGRRMGALCEPGDEDCI